MTPHNPETPMSTPTPPADTRQQAADPRAAAWQEGAQAATDWIKDGAWLATMPPNPYEGALASSSPALPKPPAPTVELDVTSWRTPRGDYVDHDASEPDVLGLVAGPARITPAEARLLASTLLAAADVAEEQQP